MLEVTGLYGGYPGKIVLRDVYLTARAGEITALMGPNGCGKSTLLKTICGILPVKAGRVTLGNTDLTALPRRELSQRAAYLAQSRETPELTVERLVLHGRFPYLGYPRRYRREDLEAARRAMGEMGVLGLAATPLGQLSGGQRQNAYIAMVLAQDTDLVLLDEPTTYLDVSCQLQFLRLARRLADSGKHVLLAIHDLSHALKVADSAALMRDGALVLQGTPEEVFASGVLEDVFNVRVMRVETPGGWYYFAVELEA